MPTIQSKKRFADVPPVKLTPQEETYLQIKFARYAKALPWNNRPIIFM